MPILNAQDITDVLRYSQSEIQGTARFRALSGAFGALGGDMSAVSINPAGSAVFSQSHASFSGSIMDVTNDTEYFGGMASTNDSNFNLSQGGASFVFKNNNTSSPWRKFTIGVAYDRTNSYDDNWFAVGANTQGNNNFDNTIASYFFDYANGLPLGDISVLDGESVADAYRDIGAVYGFGHQQAFLGFESYILEPVDIDDDNNTEYLINLENGNFAHDYSYLATGYNGKIAFNMAGQYGDNLYLGLNLNSHFIDYERSTRLFETNSNGGLINEIDFRNTLLTTGSGFSFQLGGIIKLTNEFRLGLTYDSPTWYTIQEETTQFLDTSELVALDLDIIDPQVINVYPEYKIQTPAKITGSLAYVFGKQGLISFDYSHKDYGSAQFKPTGDYTFENNQISSELAAASTYRLGGEYKHEQFSFRGGYRFEESPYVNGLTVGDLDGYSLGVGYNFGNTKLDITYDQSNRSFQTPLFNQGLTSPVSIDRTNSNITLSLSFNI
jgi:hypothetical protein